MAQKKLSIAEASRKFNSCRRFHEDVRAIIKERDLTLEDVQEEIGLTKGRIADLKYGKCSRGVILAICEWAGLNREDYFDDKTWKTIRNSKTTMLVGKNDERTQEQMTLADELTEVAESESEIPQEDIDQADLLIDIAAKLVEIEVSLKNVAEGLHNIIEATGDIENILFEKASSLLGVSWKDKGTENDK